MGEVYRATDTKLGRDVALKVLPAEMAHDAERLARFRREAKVLAQLDHPNIVTIYSVEECDGVHFLTMQLVDGQPLDRLIPQDGLPIERIVEIGSALSDALAAAHEKGIVHRDLKPANVMVSNEGRVKVLDFGLAKDVRGSSLGDATMTSASSQTQVGVVMGTPAYMSPEQTSGRPLDHRTDIFSFGVLLHEMATGRRPFEGTSSAELVSAILRDTPPSVTDLRSDLPSDLARIVRRCLEKNPRHRLQTARDVSNEFRDLVRIATRPARVSTSTPRTTAADSGATRPALREDEGFWVAVLPFKYGGANADLIALAEGLSEEVITGLSRFSYLRVIARSSTARYAGQSVDVRSAGKELNARYVMEGTLRQAGSRLRLAVQLVDTSSGAHLWAENFERAFSPEAVFELQDDLVPRIVSTVADMNGVLPLSMSQGLRNRAPDQLSPYEAVLRSFAYPYSATPEELTAARCGLEEAVRKAPTNSDAWAMLSFLCGQDYVHGYELQANALEIAASAARRAVELGPSNHLAYFSLASVLWYQKEYDSFRDAAERAVALNPMDGNSVAYMGELLTYTGSVERGMQLAERAKQLNPNHPGWYWYADFYHAFSQGDYRTALAFALKAKLRGNPLAPMFVATACGQLGDVEGGAKAAADLLKFRPELPALMRKQVAKVWNPEYGERFLEGLRNAGLDIPDASAAPQPSSVIVTARTASEKARTDEGFWIAVLPFRYPGTNQDVKALAEGLSEEVITGLSRFSYLRVIARGSTAKFSGESGDVRAIGKELGARYVMEATLRLAAGKLRLAVQLVDAKSGAHLWAENFERSLNPDAVFELQDDLVPRIVSTVADINGVLSRNMSEAVRPRAPEQLTPYEAVLRSFGYFERVTPEEMTAAIAGIESALQKTPTYADAWAMLALLLAQRYAQGFGPVEDSLAAGAAAARKAVEAAPANHLAWFSLSQVLFFQKEFQTFRNAAERALALNPMDSNSLALNGEMLALSGEWERGVSLAARARQLNPHHPGWYWHSDFNHAYRKRDYRAALEIASKMNQTSNWGAWALTAAACGQLGDRDGAAKATRELLKLRPDAVSRLREDCDKWFDAEHAAHVVEGFRKAGMEIPEIGTPRQEISSSSAPRVAVSDSGATRAAIREDEGFWVAVLTFKYTGASTDLKAFAEGLSEEIITGLSRFSYLRVIARGSTAKYSSESGDVRAIGKELGARYVMEGSLRQAGQAIRLTVQLVDATTGTHLWAETFERPFHPDQIFVLQDQLVPRIVSTVADQHGVLPRSISAAIRKKRDEQISPYEAVFRVFSLHETMTPHEHAACRDLLERVVRDAPDAADCWAMLATLYSDEDWFGFNLRPDPLGRAAAAAQRAAELAPASLLASQAVAQSLFMRHEWQAFRPVAERTIALNPMEGATVAIMGILLACSGDWERGCAVADSAMKLHPNFPGWYWLAKVFNAYRTRDYRGAIDAALRIQMPGYFWTSVVLTAAYGQLDEREPAQKSLRELLVLKPNFPSTARQEIEKWLDPELVEHFMDGLRKAGLETANVAVVTASSSGAAAHATTSGAARADEGFWVAVLPFKYTGSNADLKSLAEGLTEEIVTGLSRFSYLRVIARGSTAKYSSESGDVRAIGKELGARYVMEGSLRQAGSKLRLAVQLADTESGAHLWAETYERAFTAESMFEVQDDLVPRIVSTVADQYGILPRNMSERLRSKNEDSLTPHEAVLRAFSYFARLTAEEHATVRRILERVVRQTPDQPDSWAMLAMMYIVEYSDSYNALPNPLERALAAAQRAVDLAPSHALGHYALAWVYFFRREKASLHAAVEHAVGLNPMDGSVIGLLGLLLHHAGELERGGQMVERAMQLNPNYPGVLRFTAFTQAYCQGKYTEALEAAVRINMPGFFYAQASLAAALGQLGRREAAHKAVQDLLALRPDFAAVVRHEYAKWYEPKDIEHLIEGLRKAGLEIPKDDPKPALLPGATGVRPTSGASRTDEGFWVAILPFKYSGENRDLKALVEGLTEEIITGLSRFSYLRVIARGSTAKYSSESGDVRTIGTELGARYVMEGSLRQAGGKLRLAVQLVEATSGSHLWAETYDRSFNADAVFELQDELVPRIVSTVADKHGVLSHSMSELVRAKNPDQLTPYEAVLLSFSYAESLVSDEHIAAKACLQRTVAQTPGYSDAWSMLAMLFCDEYTLGFKPESSLLERALEAAQRAVKAGPSNHLAFGNLAYAHFLRREFGACRNAAERSLTLNPMDSNNVWFVGLLIAYMGDWERGCALVDRAMQLNPNFPGKYRYPTVANAYRKGDYRGALNEALRINMPGVFYTPFNVAAAAGQLGEKDIADRALRDLLALKPDFAVIARENLGKWFQPELVEHFIEGLRKAGLEIPGVPKDVQKGVQKDDQKQTSSGSVPVSQSIAVLPFANMSEDKEQDYFSDGLAEEIINLLAQVPGLKVIARTSAFAFRGKEQDIRDIAETLGVSTVLEGSVRRSGSRIRVTAQLINAADGSHLWSERYDRELSDIFAVQDEISTAIAKALRVKLSREAAPQRYTPKLEAYEAYLKGRYHQAKVTPESMELARRFYEQASALDPGFAMPHIGLAFYWHCLAHFARHFAGDCVSPARAEAQQALQIDPSLPEAHAFLGYIAAMYDLDWAAAERHFDSPGAKEVGFGLLRPLYAWVQFWRGKVEPAIKLAEHAIEEDPLEVWTRMNLHAYLQAADRDDEALEQLKKVLELDENLVLAQVSMAMIHADKGDLAEALKIARRAYAIGPWSPDPIGVLAGLTRRNGEEVDSSLMKALGSGEAPGDARARALYHLLCGEIDHGADWAEKAIEQRDASMMVYLRFVVCKGLRASHRWPKIAKLINLPA